MKRYKQFLVIAVATGVFGAIAVSGFGGWPVLVLSGLIAIALVDGACRQLDRGSAADSRTAAVAIVSEPHVRIVRPAMQSEQVA